ncbi:MAG: hypothetical protein KatS3mg035_2145 [Bacteroidia bacterium]|nr:MAG: hypothetical protein KatS3mg035_2145 [Bacteroidia bacterium]
MYSLAAYRFGFNGKENDNEVIGMGRWQDYGARMYRPDLARFFSPDPIMVKEQKYSYYSFYQFAGNNPIINIDIDGLEPLSVNDIINTFNDGKIALGYKITIHVDQPGSGGDRDTYEMDGLGFDVGHTFITLEKINEDGTVTYLTFGFYPKTNVSPLTGDIEVEGIIMNDKGHKYDVSKSFDLTKEQFEAVLGYLKKIEGKKYNLNKFNCTDFALECSKASGNPLPDTQGEWPGGGGSNPGDLGEDLREKNKNDEIGEEDNSNVDNTDKKTKKKL